MTEIYTNMRYLQYNTLQRLGLGHFDSWAASFGETQTAIELAYAEVISYNKKNLARGLQNESRQPKRQQSKAKRREEAI